ncbi:MAG TPA: PH domain-containing protein [Steroidobacteraceae bacterium]|nr:PH domain-containing protein [Steroidobacteraceae bacterium]
MIVEFHAPWGRGLKLATGFSVTILLLLPVVGFTTGPHQLWVWPAAMIALPLFILLTALPFMVRGYALTEHTLEIRRLGWTTTLPLAGLVKASGNVDLLRGTLRVFGNGGLFSITGWFWNRQVGFYRAYATDLSRAVFLKYRDRRPVLVTPHDTQRFLVRIGKLIAMGA